MNRLASGRLLALVLVIFGVATIIAGGRHDWPRWTIIPAAALLIGGAIAQRYIDRRSQSRTTTGDHQTERI